MFVIIINNFVYVCNNLSLPGLPGLNTKLLEKEGLVREKSMLIYSTNPFWFRKPRVKAPPAALEVPLRL